MKPGYLSQYFRGVALKRLSAVEADVLASHQHEFNGVEGLRSILGEPQAKTIYPAHFLYFTDSDDEPVSDTGFLTWYDARQRARLERGVMRWEYRLYFPTNRVSQCAAAGDLLVIAVSRSEPTKLLAVVAERNSTIERQLLWLFGQGDLAHPGFSVRSELETDQDRIGFAASVVLEQVGIEPEEQAPNYLDEMLFRFGGRFPSTVEFSQYARGTLPGIHSFDAPDAALVAWMDREEVLFRTLEKHLLAESLQHLQLAKETDPDAYMKLTLSFQQRRKTRAGSALENHLECVFQQRKIRYTRGGVTEGRLRPDFVFPSIQQYHSASFPTERITVLASKTTCKDRWRQILTEAAKVRTKHLVTLEPGISEHQTAEMRAENVQLVLPAALHSSFTSHQRANLITLGAFLEMVETRQCQ